MTQKSELGKIGEDFACGYLVKNGYKLVERNYRKPWGELDIIVIAPGKTLVFVEVKTMKSDFSQGLSPEDQMTSAKLRKFKKAATLYAGSHQNLINDKRGWRLDLIAVETKGKSFDVRHYKNVV